MTEIEYRPIYGSNMEEADEHYKEIIQEANYSHYSFWNNVDRTQYVDST